MTNSTPNTKAAVGARVAETRQHADVSRASTTQAKGLGGFIVRNMGAPGSWRNTIIGLAALAIVSRLILFMDLNQQTLNLLNVVFIYSIVATGIAFLYSYGGLLSIAHGALWGVGSYVAAIEAQNHGWPMIPVALVAMVICAALATALAALSFRVEGSYFIIILFAVAQVIYGVETNWSVTGGSEGIVMSVHPSLFGITFNSNMSWYWLLVIVLILTLGVVQAAKQSRLGQRMKAIRDNRALSTSVGIDIVRTHMVAFAISGAIAAVSGVFWGYFEGYVVPSEFTAGSTIEFVVVILLGGSAYLLGPTAGALVVIFLPKWLHLSPLLGDAMIGVVFIAIILISPAGIAGLFDRGFHSLLSWLVHQHIDDPELLESDFAAEAAIPSNVGNEGPK